MLVPVKTSVMVHFALSFQFVSTIFMLDTCSIFFLQYLSVLLGTQIMLLYNTVVTKSVTPG